MHGSRGGVQFCDCGGVREKVMTANRKTISCFRLTLLGGVGRAGAENSRAGVGGRVLGESSPLAKAGVYVYQIADLSLHKVLTDTQGSFLFQDLPAGLYKIIAHKPGFIPVVLPLTRTTAQAYQFVELQLEERQAGGTAKGKDFWSVRSEIPGDVLRQIEGDELDQRALLTLALPSQKLDLGDLAKAGFRTDLQAMTGVDQIASPEGGLLSGAGVGIEGRLGKTQVDLHGSYWQIDSSQMGGRPGFTPAAARTSTLSLDLARSSGSRLVSSSLSNRMARVTMARHHSSTSATR